MSLHPDEVLAAVQQRSSTLGESSRGQPAKQSAAAPATPANGAGPLRPKGANGRPASCGGKVVWRALWPQLCSARNIWKLPSPLTSFSQILHLNQIFAKKIEAPPTSWLLYKRLLLSLTDTLEPSNFQEFERALLGRFSCACRCAPKLFNLHSTRKR